MPKAATGSNTGDLIIDSPNSAPLRVHLDGEQYSLGRSPANDLAFPSDQKLSRDHIIFERRGHGWAVRDVGSKNGTQLNGAKLTETTPLSHGDQIVAGHLCIRYDIYGEFADAGPTDVTFVREDAGHAEPTISLDLQAALRSAGDSGGRTSMANQHFQALVQAGRELAGHGALETLFDLILDLSLKASNASRGVVMTCEEKGALKIRAIRGEGLRISAGVRDLVLDKGKSVLIQDARSDQDFGMRESILAQDIRSILAVPLQTDERVIGLLYLDSPFWVRGFTTEDLNLLTVMANMAAIRIEHARLTAQEQMRKMFARELEKAAEIQRRLLPSKPPEIVGFDLAGYNATCLAVGGDYYDFLPYPDGRLGILIGDVSGKGLGAALLMSNVQASVRVLLEEPGPLETQICRLNRSFAANCPGNCFITFFAAVLDVTTGELVHCNAGHNPPLLLHADDEVESLGATGFPLGISRNATYELNHSRLEPGDTLLLYSDGVTEACSPSDEEFGDRRLIAAIRQNRNRPAVELIRAITSELETFTAGAPAADDITLVALRRS
ncbi:MAG: SpoIIE family protein phosphatase [Acidobacteriaceae bacterium]|nr:SpoIIE family protein phosphatase [Acidobacteriaceae bacterium]